MDMVLVQENTEEAYLTWELAQAYRESLLSYKCFPPPFKAFINSVRNINLSVSRNS